MVQLENKTEDYQNCCTVLLYCCYVIIIVVIVNIILFIMFISVMHFVNGALKAF